MNPEIELAYAKHVLPMLEQTLVLYNACHKQLDMIPEQQQTRSLLLDIIGITELKMALANAIIYKSTKASNRS